MSSNFAIRLSVEGARQAGAALKGVPVEAAEGVKKLGDTSERTGQRMRGLRADTSSVTPAMRALDTAAKDVRGSFDSFASRVPVIGGALKALGPAGVAAAAGVVAVGVALRQGWQQGRETMKAMADIMDQAQNLSVSVEGLQALQAAARENGVETEKLVGMLAALELNGAKAANGQGKLFSALREVNPELVQQIAAAKTQEERWNTVAAAIQNTTDHTQRVNIATAAFGKQGVSLIRVLEQQESSVGELIGRYREMGIIIDEDTVRSVDKLDEKYDMLAKVIDVNLKKAFIDLAPTILAVAKAFADATVAYSDFMDNFDGSNAVDTRSTRLIERQIETTEGLLRDARDAIAREREALADGVSLGEAMLGVSEERLERLITEFTGRQRTLSSLYLELSRRDGERGAIPTGSGEVLDPAAEEAAAEAERKAAEALRIRAGYEREAIQLRAELGDITGLLAARQAELNTLVAAGVGITREMADEVMARYRASLDGTAAAQARINAILDEGKTPLERINDEIVALTAAWEASGRTLENYGAALAALKTKQQDIIAGTMAMTAAANDNAGALDAAAAAYPRLAEGMGEMRRMSLEVEFGMAGIVGILDQQIETWEDAGVVALRVLRDIAIQAMFTASQMQGANLGSIISAGFGVFMGGGGGAQPAVQPQVWDGTYTAGSYWHEGGLIGDPTASSRMLPSRLFDNAPRFHRGLAPDEFPAVLQKNERVLSADHNERFVRAIEGGGDVSIRIHNYGGGEVETRETRGPDGSREVDILLGRKTDSHLAGGGADAAMRSRYGARPVLGR